MKKAILIVGLIVLTCCDPAMAGRGGGGGGGGGGGRGGGGGGGGGRAGGGGGGAHFSGGGGHAGGGGFSAGAHTPSFNVPRPSGGAAFTPRPQPGVTVRPGGGPGSISPRPQPGVTPRPNPSVGPRPGNLPSPGVRPLPGPGVRPLPGPGFRPGYAGRPVGPGGRPPVNYAWHHGDWNNHWHPWYWRPAAWWGAGFGLGLVAGTPWSWGYCSYDNPYYTAPIIVGGTTIDYSQPIVVAEPPAQPPAGDPEAQLIDPAQGRSPRGTTAGPWTWSIRPLRSNPPTPCCTSFAA